MLQTILTVQSNAPTFHLPGAGLMLDETLLLYFAAFLIVAVPIGCVVLSRSCRRIPATKEGGEVLWESNRARAWCCLVLFATCCATSALAQNTFTVFVRAIARKTGHTVATATIVYTVHNCCIGLFAVPATMMCRSVGMRSMFGLTLFLLIVAYTGLCLATSLFTFVACYTLLGYCVAVMYVPCIMATIGIVPSELQGTASGAVSMCFAGGSVPLMAPIAQGIRRYGVSKVYFVMGVGTTALVGLCLLLLPAEGDEVTIDRPEAPKAADEGGRPRRGPPPRPPTLTNCQIATLCFAYLMGMCSYNLVESNLEPILHDTLSDNYADVGVTVGLLLHTFGYAFWGTVTAGFSGSLCICACGVLQAASLLTWSVGASTPPWHRSVQLLGSSVAAFCTPGHIAIMPTLVSRLVAHEQEAGRILSIIVLTETAAVITPLATHAASTLGWPKILLLYMAVPCLMIATMVVLAPKDSIPEDTRYTMTLAEAKLVNNEKVGTTSF